MNDSIHTHTFPNGLTLIAEPMDWLESAAFTLMVPAGSVYEPADRLGLSGFTTEMLQRGSGSHPSREFVDDLENLGVDFSAGVSVAHSTFGASMLAETLPEALSIFADVVRKPHLDEEEVDDTRQGCLQELRSLDDDPPQQVFIELRRRQYPDPWGRSTQGNRPAVEAISIDDVRQFFGRQFQPHGAILSVAGKLNWEPIRDAVWKLFGDWEPSKPVDLVETAPEGNYAHLPFTSQQTHLAVAYPSVPYQHPDYYQAWGAMSVLGSGMSSRLFTEIRENRGLCYTVSAGYNSLKDRGSIRCYAGTRAERAQETLDVLLAELSRFAEGIRKEELDRVQARIKTVLILQQESSRSRSASNAGDWYFLGRVPSLNEVHKIVDGLTCETINKYLAANPPGDYTIVTLGPKPLEVRLEFKHHKLANGLEIVAECNPRAYSFGAAFFVNTGSRDEDAPIAGVSHFLEHMMFKGTAKRSASDVNRELDEIGSRANAYTSEEHTVYHAVVLPEYQERLVELLADMLRPALRESDFTTEKQVILEEISKYDDEPPFRVAELCMAAYFNGHPLANSVLGSVESVSGLTPESMRAYFERRYRPGNVVLAAAGCVDFARLIELAEQYCGAWSQGKTPRARPPVKPRSGFEVLTKSTATQQYTFKIAPGPSSDDPDRFAADILAAVIGDDSGSRLYWELTDTGRVDFAVMGADQYDAAGAIISYLCCEPGLMGENLQRIVDVQREVERDNITAKELAQAQNKICSHLVRQSERPASRMFSIGNSWLQRREYLSVRDLVDAYRNVKLDDIASVIAKYPLTAGQTVTIGPLDEVKAPEQLGRMSKPRPAKIEVLYEDNHLLAVNKPAGLATQGAAEGEASVVSQARDYLKQKYAKPGNVYIGVVSRLDALVTGVVVLARTSKAAARLTEQFGSRDVEKTYWALVEGNVQPEEGDWVHTLAKDESLKRVVVVDPRSPDAQDARLHYRVLARLPGTSLLEIRLETGRKHQIRVQATAMGHPILGDSKYGSRRTFSSGIALHARRLALQHPVKKEPWSIAAPLPASWKSLGFDWVQLESRQ